MPIKRNAGFDRTDVRAWVVALALGCVWLNAGAAKLPQWGSSGVSKNGNSYSINPGGGDLRVPITKPVGNWQSAGNYGTQLPPTGPTMNMSGDGKVFFATPDGWGSYGGVNYPFKVSGGISLLDIAGAAGGLMGGPVGVGIALGAPLLKAWIEASGARVAPDGSSLQLQQANEDGNYKCQYAGGAEATGGSAKTCATQAMKNGGRSPPDYYASDDWPDGSNNYWNVHPAGQPGASLGTISVNTIKQSSSGWNNVGVSDVVGLMNNQRPDAGIVGELLNKGADVPFPSTTTTTGPTTIVGPTSTTTNADGTKTIVSTSSVFTVTNNTITNTSNVTTTTVYNTDNSVRSVSTKTDKPAATTDQKPDTPPIDPCKEKPDSVGCAVLDDQKGDIPRENKMITYAEEDTFGGGSCPADKQWTSGLMGQSYKLVDWGTFCGYAYPVRALVLLLALFAAFLIVMPGKEVRT